jgi:hypothetical protein
VRAVDRHYAPGGMAPFDVDDLRRRGFEGFVAVEKLHGLKPDELPDASGVYVVVRTSTGPPAFLERSDAGRWKGKDPTVPLERHRREWVDGAQTLYIGKATSLRGRVGLLLDFGRGDPVMHYGGRLLWQVERCEEFVIAWRKAATIRFAALETALIDEFIAHFGRLPFANLRRGDNIAR